MHYLFEKHKAKTLYITKEELEKFKTKTYETGEPIQIGDTVLFALLEQEVTDESLTYKMIAVKEKHLDDYNITERGDFPTLSKKQ